MVEANECPECGQLMTTRRIFCKSSRADLSEQPQKQGGNRVESEKQGEGKVLFLPLLLLLAGWSGATRALTSGPDDFGYVLADQNEPGVSYSWVDMNLGTELALVDDETSASLAIGFSFAFYGETFDHVFVNGNGMLWFWYQDDPSFTGTQCPLPVQDLVDAGIAFYHRPCRSPSARRPDVPSPGRSMSPVA